MRQEKPPFTTDGHHGFMIVYRPWGNGKPHYSYTDRSSLSSVLFDVIDYIKSTEYMPLQKLLSVYEFYGATIWELAISRSGDGFIQKNDNGDRWQRWHVRHFSDGETYFTESLRSDPEDVYDLAMREYVARAGLVRTHLERIRGLDAPS